MSTRVPVPAGAAVCPKCRVAMNTFEHDRIPLDLCPQCKGIWFDPGELSGILRTDVPSLGGSASMDLFTGAAAGPCCPRDGSPLSERRMAEDAGLLVDVCPRCEGIFLDRGELERVRHLARRPRHIAAADLRAIRATSPDPRVQRRNLQTTYERMRAIKPRARAQWHTWSSAGPGRMLLYVLGLPTEEDNALTRTPIAVYGLILLNLAVWIWQIGGIGLQESVDLYGMVPDDIRHGTRSWTLLSSMFVHGGWLHLIGNLYILWLFGDNVEDRVGSFTFVLLYLTAGIGADALTLALTTGDAAGLPHVGASGAIAGVMAAYMILFPGSRILAVFFNFLFLYVLVIPVPAWVYLGFWLLLQALGVFGGVGGTAWWSHIGGFALGFLIAGIFRGISKPRD